MTETIKEYIILLQDTIIIIENSKDPITISAMYYPPRHRFQERKLSEFFNALGNHIIAGSNYNAKHHR